MEETICQIVKMQMTLSNTANSILGTLNGNTQQSDEGERKPKKHKQQQQADSSDDANIKRLLLVLLGHIK